MQKNTFDCCLKTIFSTDSVLSPESFSFVYNTIKQDVCLASISGRTDIFSFFVLGNPIPLFMPGKANVRA